VRAEPTPTCSRPRTASPAPGRRSRSARLGRYTGHILTSINPCKIIPNLYSAETMVSYVGQRPGTARAPHLFAIAAAVYRQLTRPPTKANFDRGRHCAASNPGPVLTGLPGP